MRVNILRINGRRTALGREVGMGIGVIQVVYSYTFIKKEIILHTQHMYESNAKRCSYIFNN